MRQSKYCNCHISTNKTIIKSSCTHSFCDRCGCALLKDKEGNIYYTLKPKQSRLPYDLSPITVIKNMKKKTEEEYPFIYQEYNIDKADRFVKDNSLNSINIYLNHRKMLLLKLQKLIKAFDYCDKVFYQCLFYLDEYLSHNMSEDISAKKLLYYLIGFFLCSVKFKETDIYEPSLDSFYDLSKGIYLSTDKIAYYEVLCLKKINYNVFSYSVYDWITQLISNGIIFNCEVNKDNEIIIIKGHRHSVINAINKYAIKLLLNLTDKYLFFKYAPMYTAISLIQIAREKYINKAMIKPKLFSDLIKIYGINPNSYKKCYEEIKSDINEISNQENKEKKNDDLNNIERKESTKNASINKYKNIYVPNKIKSSNVLTRVTNNLEKKSINNDNQAENSNSKETEKSNEDKEIELNLEEIKSKDKNISKKKIKNDQNIKLENHLSIDCNSRIYQSNDNIPYINPNYKEGNLILARKEAKLQTSHSKNLSLSKKKNRPSLKELKHIRQNPNNRYNSIESKNVSTNSNTAISSIKKENKIEALKKKSKFFSNKNINLVFNSDKADIVESTKISKMSSKKLPKISGFEEFNMDRMKPNNEEHNGHRNRNRNKKHYKLKTNIKVTLPEDEIKLINDSKK